jgi:hypothetical protein
MASAFVLCPAIALGIIIGITEFAFVHADEPGGIGIGHAMHALPSAIIFVFISMNISFVANLVGLKLTENFMLDMGIRAAVAIVAMIKIQAAAAIGRGVGEKLPHTFVIGLLIFGAPYLWTYVLQAAVGAYLPC